jgi:hypothetical protein
MTTMIQISCVVQNVWSYNFIRGIYSRSEGQTVLRRSVAVTATAEFDVYYITCVIGIWWNSDTWWHWTRFDLDRLVRIILCHGLYYKLYNNNICIWWRDARVITIIDGGTSRLGKQCILYNIVVGIIKLFIFE